MGPSPTHRSPGTTGTPRRSTCTPSRSISKPTLSRGALRSSPNGIRTRAATLRGWCPRPLDDGAKHEIVHLTCSFASVEDAVRVEPPEGGDAPYHRAREHYRRAGRTVRTDAVTCANSYRPSPRNVYRCPQRRRVSRGRRPLRGSTSWFLSRLPTHKPWLQTCRPPRLHGGVLGNQDAPP